MKDTDEHTDMTTPLYIFILCVNCSNMYMFASVINVIIFIICAKTGA